MPRAQFSLGEAYENGIGLPKDDVEAVTWWEKAANLGNADAQYDLGVAYANGNGGLAKDDASSLRLVSKSSRSGESRS